MSNVVIQWYSAGIWAGLVGPKWLHSHVWYLGGECWKAGFSWDSWSEGLRMTFQHGNTLVVRFLGWRLASSRENIPWELDVSCIIFADLASGISITSITSIGHSFLLYSIGHKWVIVPAQIKGREIRLYLLNGRIERSHWRTGYIDTSIFVKYSWS